MCPNLLSSRECLESGNISVLPTFYPSKTEKEIDHSETKDSHILDVSQFQEQYRGKPQVLRQLAEFYLEDSADWLAKLHDAMEKKDARTVTDIAHSLKGMVGNFPAPEAHSCVNQFHELAHHNDWQSIIDLYPSVVEAMNAMAIDMKSILESNAD